MPKEYPFVIFVTNANCDHCRKFRGVSGLPITDSWNNSYIKQILYGDVDNPKKEDLKVSKIIELHDKRGFGNKINYIGEVNIYLSMPINQNIDDDFIINCMSDDCNIFGNAILRISIFYSVNGLIDFDVRINNVDNDKRCERIKSLLWDFFVWNALPDQVFLLRCYFQKYIKNGDELELSDGKMFFNINTLLSQLVNYELYDSIINRFHTFESSPASFDSLLLSNYNFDWFLSKFLPSRLRDVERFYPTWMLVLPSEWEKAKYENTKLYVKVLNCKTILQGNKYITVDSTPEKLVDIISMYWKNRLFLTYEENLTKSTGVKFSDSVK